MQQHFFFLPDTLIPRGPWAMFFGWKAIFHTWGAEMMPSGRWVSYTLIGLCITATLNRGAYIQRVQRGCSWAAVCGQIHPVLSAFVAEYFMAGTLIMKQQAERRTDII